jgi:hypothetical protein
MSRLNHYACLEDHPKGRGRPWPGNHRPGCPVADGHDSGRMISACRACAREYQSKDWVPPQNPIVGTPRVLKERPNPWGHYACALAAEEHEVRRSVGRGHRAGCAVSVGHTPGVSSGGLDREKGQGCGECIRQRARPRIRAKDLKSRHGITIEQYDRLFAEQGGRCAICRREQANWLSMDHDHASGEKRGLLCKPCNLGLGNFRDDPEVLIAAARYLQSTRPSV